MNNYNMHDSPTSAIGSPRMMTPRSHRTQRTMRSGHSHRPRQQPNAVYEPHDPHNVAEQQPQSLVAEHLHQDNSIYNVDPGAPMLGAGEESIEEAIRAEDERNDIRRERNFVGGFVVGLKKALKPTWTNRQRSDPEAAYGETPYEEADYTAPDPAVIEDQHVYTRPEYSPRSNSSESQPSPSETMHGGTQEYLDDGTTAVDHQQMPMGTYVSPVVVEPQLAPDYAKMGPSSPTATEASMQTYMSRVAQFFRHLNDLPWVAESRVTVDYYPGQSTSRRRVRPRPAHRPVLSWYNRLAFQPGQNAGTLDLDAGSPPSAPAPGQNIMMAEVQSMYKSDEAKFQPLILPALPVPESEMNTDAPTYLAEPITPPPRSDTQHSARTGRSVVYSVVNPSARSTSSSSTTSPPRNRMDPMTALAQTTTGYTPYQPSAPQYGRAIHEPVAQVPVSPPGTVGVPRQPPLTYVRGGTPAQPTTYPYPSYTT
ncbi:hypothetical protein BDP27DRAFT_1325816 [Rhodocollybia butyracea]|uniref:Uncharacterized protein n=1 Tax=Rhodocollybia butyracea TaxID=206335 RepID=A0A9P5PU68_9AGAR|nr:hypothetical protein BDP27DRAFT_1325816 [Rhodocollybia butyracea]